MRWRISVAVLIVFAVFSLASASDQPLPKYSFVVRPSANGVQLECKSGCAWITRRTVPRRLASSRSMNLAFGASDQQPTNMALQRTRAARFARIGSPLNAQPLGPPTKAQ
jgi:hypothetical protein